MKAPIPIQSKNNINRHDIKSTVALVSCRQYDDSEVKEAVDKGIQLLGGISAFAAPGEKILLKPNLLIGDEPSKASTTHPTVLKAVAQAFIEAKADVSYGDSPGLGKPERAARGAKYQEIAQSLGLRLADFVSSQIVSFPQALLAKQLHLAKGALDADGIISLPKMKTHGFTRVTGAVKNQFGCIPGMRKAEFHVKMPDIYEFSKVLVDINLYLKPRLYIMDGIIAMEGNGPRGGEPVNMNVLLFSSDPVAIDTVCCRLMNLKPHFVPTNPIGHEAGLGTSDLNHIDIITSTGEPVGTFIKIDFKAVHRPPDRIISSPFYPKFLKNRISPRPVILKQNCIRCGKCVLQCPVKPKALNWPKAMSDKEKPLPNFNYNRCIRCYCCQEICPEKAIKIKTPLLGRLIHR